MEKMSDLGGDGTYISYNKYFFAVMKKTILSYVIPSFILSFFLISGAPLKAQRTVHSAVTSGCFRQAVTPIQTVPPLHTDMNLDCLIGYIYFDSLCRASVTRAQLDSMASLINSWDTLKPFVRFKYRMTEYNADEYAEYCIAGVEINSSYKTYPAVIDQLIDDRMGAVLGPKHKLTYITNAALILRVHVESIYDDADSLASIPIAPLPMKCVTASVVDTIKGIHFRQCQSIGQSIKYHQKPQNNPPCISFSFSPYWQKEKYRKDVISGGVFDTLANESIPCDNCYGQISMEVGKDYVIFLKNSYHDYNGTYSYFDTYPYSKFSAEGGIFPILDNGKVSIPSNYFGYGTEVSYSQFISSLQADINTIISH